jgi:hypothetical protein
VKYRVYGVTVTSDVPLADVPRSTASSQISIASEGSQDTAPIPVFHEWRLRGDRRKRPWLSIARADDGYLLRFPDLADFRVSQAGDRITCLPRARLAPSTLGHLLLDQILPLALSRRGVLALHASAVFVPGLGTVAFVGPTGCGKSTLAAALGLSGGQLLTDDCLVVDVDSARAVPGYPGVRLWRDSATGLNLQDDSSRRVAHYSSKRRVRSHAMSFRSKPSGLAAVFVLGRRRRRGLPTRAQVLESREQLMSLAPCVYIMDVRDRGQLAAMFRGLTALVSRVPVARLNLREGKRQAREAAAEVLALASSLAGGR